MSTLSVGTASVATSLVAATNTYPTVQGSSGQVLITNGSGTLSWADQSAAGGGVEGFTNSGTSLNGGVDMDLKTMMIYHYTANSGGTWQPNFRGDGSTSLNNYLSNNETITCVMFVPCNNNGRYPSQHKVDGSVITPKWIGGFGAPTGGHSGAIDIYTYTILKTGSGAFSIYANQNFYT